MRADVTRAAGTLDLDKALYSVSVASEILSSDPRTLMMYEDLGLAVPKRTAANRRRYTSRDILGINALQRLTRWHGLNVAGARYVIRYLQLLDSQRMPRPLELASIRVEHVRL
jgi:MerR family transcriptional regulator, heat shock protein HspR